MTATARKQPKQSRSKATVDAIVQAAAQVLIEDGYDRASTNRIAKVAGVSIGSLYQYFPNKEAVLIAVAERHADEMLALLGQTMVDLGAAPIPVAVRTYVQAMIRVHEVDPELHQALVQLVIRHGLERFEETDRRAIAMITAYLHQRRDEILPEDPAAAAWVLVHLVESLTHVHALKRPVEIDADTLIDEITAVVVRYLLGEGASPATA